MTVSPSSSDQIGSVDTHDALRRAIRIEVLEELADCLGADLCNIFTVISGMLQLRLLESNGEVQDCRRTQSALDSARRGALLAQNLLNCVGPQVPVPRCVEPVSFITKQLSVNKQIGAMVAFTVHSTGQPWQAYACPIALASILQKLADNASCTMQDGGRFQVFIRNVAGAVTNLAEPLHGSAARDFELTRDFVLMSVKFPRLALTDNEIANVLRPLFLIKASGGAVLNLYDSFASIRRSGGDVTIENSPSCLGVHIWLPRAKWLSPEWFTQPET
jgi:hypothetical protein